MLAYFGQIPEDMHVEHASTKAAVEAFDEAVLHRSTGFDEVEPDAFAFCPLCERQGEKFRAVVQPKLCGIAAPCGNKLERANITPTLQRSFAHRDLS